MLTDMRSSFDGGSLCEFQELYNRAEDPNLSEHARHTSADALKGFGDKVAIPYPQSPERPT
jgi:hypothetical protein